MDAATEVCGERGLTLGLRRADRRPMAFVGMWEYSHNDDGERVES